MILYSVGTNITRYLPETAPYVTADRDDAAEYMSDEIAQTAEYYAEGLEDDDRIPATLAELDTLLADLTAWQEDRDNEHGWGDTFIGHAPARSYWVERLTFDTWGDAWSYFTGEGPDHGTRRELEDRAAAGETIADVMCEMLGEMDW